MAASAATVSAVLIVKDEEDVLASCLEALTWADEIVVYDTGSTDATRDIARLYTDKVIEGYWDDDFGAARNRAKDHATMEWHLTVDADEVFVGDPAHVRAQLAAATPSTVGFMVVVENVMSNVFVGSTDSNGLRIFRREWFTWRGALHEQPVPLRNGSTVNLRSALLRHSGYGRMPAEVAEKGERNLRVAEAELEQAEASGTATPAELATIRANLARSLGIAGRPGEALDLGEAVWGSGDLGVLAAETLARGMTSTALAGHRPRAEVEAWIDRWLSVAGNAAWPYAARAEVASRFDDPAGVIDALERVPTRVVNSTGQRLQRRTFARLEVEALAALGRTRQACEVAVATAAAGGPPITATELLTWLGEEGMRDVLAAMGTSTRRTFALLCATGASEADRTALRHLRELGPVDVTLAYCAQRVAPAMDLEEATEWAVVVRAAGLGELCPVVALARASAVEPRRRALAAALAVSAFADERALPALEEALAQVAPEDEAALLGELDVVAPGLVTAS